MSEHALHDKKGSGEQVASGNPDPFKDISEKEQMLYWRVFIVIKSRTKLNPVKSPVLEQQFEISGSRVRKIVHFFRYKGLMPIVSGNDGYYFARKYAEWKPCADRLKKIGISVLNGIDNITKHNFSGQAEIFEN